MFETIEKRSETLTGKPASERSPEQLSPPTTRTRCPNCKKLFAVETSVLVSMQQAGVLNAEFTCTSDLCRQAFAIDLPVDTKLAIVPARAIFHLEQTEQESVKPSTGRTSAGRVAAEPAPLDEEPLRSVIDERECPRCGAMNAAANADCVRCGIVFLQRFEDGETPTEEMELGGTRELAALWGKVLEDYEDRIRHDRFVNACRDSDALSYAAKKYAQVLVSAPQDDVARLMRNRIVALVSAKAESSKLPFRLGFRIPKFNSMALFCGSVMFFWGLIMPQLKNIMEIGLSVVLLSIGVRLALRQRI